MDLATRKAATIAARKAGLSVAAWLDMSIRAAAEIQLKDATGPDEGEGRTVARRDEASRSVDNAGALAERLEDISRRLDRVDEGTLEPLRSRMDEMEHELRATEARGGVSKTPLEWTIEELSERTQILEQDVAMNEIESATKRALSLHQAGLLDEAAESYLQIITDQPDNGDALNGMGVLAYQRQDLTMAADYLELAVDANPGAADFNGNLGAVYAAMGRFEDAKQVLERAAKLNPMAADVQGSLGAVYRALGDRNAAVDACRRAIDLNPELYEAHGNLALALLELGRTSEALEAAEAAVATNATDASAHNNLGAVMAALGRWEEAHAQFHLAVSLDPAHEEARRNLDRLNEQPHESGNAVANAREAAS